MKKTKIFLLVILSILCFFTLVACNNKTTEGTKENTTTLNNEDTTDASIDVTTLDPGTTTEEPGTTTEEPGTTTEEEVTTTKEENPLFNEVVFEDLTVTYDGEKHAIKASALPKGATVKYNPTFGQTNAGEYTYRATVTIDGESKVFRATLKINKAVPVVTAESEQTFYLSDGYVTPLYSVDTEGLKVIMNPSVFTKAGEYDCEIYTKEEANYSESEHVSVRVIVMTSKLGIDFKSATYVMEGNDPITLSTTDIEGVSQLDSKYEATLSQSEFTAQGKYKVSLSIKDTTTDTVVEEHRAIITIDYPDNEDFTAFENDMFFESIEGDQMVANLFFVNPDEYGLEHYDAIYYTYEKDDYTEEERESDRLEVEKMRSDYNSFKDQKLSYRQLNTYMNINGLISYYEAIIENYDTWNYMGMAYVDQYGGYAADFPTSMEAYTIRRLVDLTDIISYVDSMYDALMSYMEWIEDKEELGYGYSEFTLNSYCEYLDGVAETGDEYYLIDILKDKITGAKELLNLSDEDVNGYLAELDAAFVKFINGHKELSAAVKAYVEEAKKPGGYLYEPTAEEIAAGATPFEEGYISIYDGGKEYYEFLLRRKLGIYDMSIEDYIKEVDSATSKYLRSWISLSRKLTPAQEAIADGEQNVIKNSDPAAHILFLKEFAKGFVPDLETNPSIDFAWMDDTVTENTTTVAYYMKSPLDSFDKEYIHLNGRALGSDKLDTMVTIAHEGYPGHLYAYVFAKESDQISNYVTLNTNTGFGEGWAKYVELAVYDYIKEIKDDEDWTIALEYATLYQLFSYLLYTRVDVGIGYEGWGVDEIANYLESKGLNDSMAEDLFHALTESPTSYAAYGYGLYYTYTLHENAKKDLGNYFDMVSFNEEFLSHGWIPLDFSREYMSEYMENLKFLYKLDTE